MSWFEPLVSCQQSTSGGWSVQRDAKRARGCVGGVQSPIATHEFWAITFHLTGKDNRCDACFFHASVPQGLSSVDKDHRNRTSRKLVCRHLNA
ncbi:hypothetical protein Plhal304r1_c042g0121801 [Plasmopara halstedii]